MADRSGEKEATAPSVDIERQREMNGHWSRTRTCVQIFMMTSVGTNLSHLVRFLYLNLVGAILAEVNYLDTKLLEKRDVNTVNGDDVRVRDAILSFF